LYSLIFLLKLWFIPLLYISPLLFLVKKTNDITYVMVLKGIPLSKAKHAKRDKKHRKRKREKKKRMLEKDISEYPFSTPACSWVKTKGMGPDARNFLF
jgi:hypothetical protein